MISESEKLRNELVELMDDLKVAIDRALCTDKRGWKIAGKRSRKLSLEAASKLKDWRKQSLKQEKEKA